MTDRRRHGQGALWQEKRVKGAVWCGQISVNGAQRQKVLGPVRRPGTKDGLTRTGAERALREFRAHAERQLAQPPGGMTRSTLADVAHAHLRHLEVVKNRRASTLENYAWMLNTHLLAYFGGDTCLDDITARHVEAFAHDRLGSGLAHGTVANCTNLLNAVFAYAVKRNLAERNPCPDADTPRARARDTDIRFLWMSEVERLIAHVPDDGLGAVERVMYLTAAMTGLRQGELLALRWQDVELETRRLRVRFSISRGRLSKPKTRASERTVPLPSPVVKALKEHRLASRYGAETDAVFTHPTKGTHYCVSTLIGRFRQTCRRAGLDRPGVNFHSLRHTYATTLASSGVPIVAIQRFLGHSDMATTQIYAAWSSEGQEDTVLADRAFANNGETTAGEDNVEVA